MYALVPQGDFFSVGRTFHREHTRQAAQLLGLHRVALVRHRARALYRPRNGSATSPTSGGGGSRRHTNSTVAPSDAQAWTAVGASGRGLSIAHGLKPEVLARTPRRPGRRCEVGADRARELALGDAVDRARRCAGGRAAGRGTRGPAWRRRWSARRGCRGCGPDRGVPERLGTRHDSRASSASTASRSSSQARRERDRQRGVDDVAGGEAVVQYHRRGRRRSPWTTSTNAAVS